MKVSAESYGHTVMLNVQGELTEDGLDAFTKAMEHQLEGKNVIDLVLNLANVPFIDSAAMECLLDLQDRLSEKLGQVKLAQPDDNIRKILEITRLESTFEIYDDVAQAVKALQM